MTLRTLSRRFFGVYAVVTAITVHVAAAAHYAYLEHTCLGWDCLGVAVYGRALVLVVVGLAVVAAGVIALDSALARVYGGESR